MLYFTGTAVLSTLMSDNVITPEEAGSMASSMVTYSNHNPSNLFVWSLAKMVCMRQSPDICRKVVAKLEQFNFESSDSISILKGMCARSCELENVVYVYAMCV